MGNVENSSQSQTAAGYLTSLSLVQVAHNGTLVVLPVLLLELWHEPAALGMVAGGISLFDLLGTFWGTAALRRYSAATLGLITLIGRMLVFMTLAVALARVSSDDQIYALIAAVLMDALLRGIADPAKHSVPVLLCVGQPTTSLQRLNASSHIVGEMGNFIGPLLIGFVLAWFPASTVVWIIVLAYAAAAGVFWRIVRGLHEAHVEQVRENGLASSERPQHSSGTSPLALRWLLLLQASITTYPTKAVLPGLIAIELLHDPKWTAWLVAIYGLGGLLGSGIYRRTSGIWTLPRCLLASGPGLVIFAWSFIYGTAWWIAAALLLCSATNVIARLNLLASTQTHHPAAAVGYLRSTANGTSLALRFGLGLCFKFPASGFVLAASLLTVFGCAQTVGAIVIRRRKVPTLASWAIS